MCDFLGLSCYSYQSIPIGFFQTLYDEMMTLKLSIYSKEFDKDDLVITCIDIHGISDSAYVRRSFLKNIRYLIVLAGSYVDILYLQIQRDRVLFASSTQLNVQEVSTLSVRNAYYFIYNDIYFPLSYQVTDINRLQDFKQSISAIYNTGNANLVINGVILIQLIGINTGFDEFGFLTGYLRMLNINTRTDKQTFDSIFLYDLSQGSLISYFKDKAIFAWNTKNFYMCNHYPYLSYSSTLRSLTGGKRSITIEPISRNTARVCSSTELHDMLPELDGELIPYIPMKKYIPFVCRSFTGQGTTYLYGFTNIHDYLNAAGIFQLATPESNQNNLYFFSVPLFFIQEKLPREPFYEGDGLIVWLNEVGYLLIYEPTFYVPFLENNASTVLSISDLRVIR